MRTRWMGMLAGLAVAAAACTAGLQGTTGPGAVPASPIAPASTAGEVLVLGSASGAAIVDAETGSELFASVGAPALGDWSTLATATVSGGIAHVRVIRDVSGELL